MLRDGVVWVPENLGGERAVEVAQVGEVEENLPITLVRALKVGDLLLGPVIATGLDFVHLSCYYFVADLARAREVRQGVLEHNQNHPPTRL